MTPEGFSDKVEGLRLVWDATALSAYMKDPLAYYWQFVLGYRNPNPSISLVFGSAWADVTAAYRGLRLVGFSKDDALKRTIRDYIGSPHSHELHEAWKSAKDADKKKRSLYTLVRSLIWWADNYENDGWNPIMLSGNRPALEYNFLVPLGMKSITGEDYLLTGYFDEIVQEDDEQFVLERKTTTTTLGTSYFQKYDPCIQTYLYDLVGSYILPHNPLRGVVVEACQSVVEFSRFDRHEILRSKPQREHFEKVLRYWIERAEHDAINKLWPVAMNTESNTFWSTYKDIERRPPFAWNGLLQSELKRETLWNPMIPRTIEVNRD